MTGFRTEEQRMLRAHLREGATLVYALPDDCQTILLIVNPIFRYRLKYVPTYTLQWQNVFSRVFFSNFQSAFCDGAYDDDTEKTTIQMAPAPSATAQYLMIYRRRAPAFTTLAQKPITPPEYSSALESLAEYKVRKDCGLAGWSDCKENGWQQVKSMRRKYTAAPMYDTYASYWQYPFYEDSSVYAGGLFVQPTSA